MVASRIAWFAAIQFVLVIQVQAVALLFQLAVLRELCAWREQQARARDLPRNRIIREHSLWPLAKTQPDNLAALGKIEDMHPRTVRQDGQFLLDLIKRAGSVSIDQWPPAVAEPLPVDAATLIKQLRALGQAEAERLDMAPELMLRKKTLEALVKSGYPTVLTNCPIRCVAGAAN